MGRSVEVWRACSTGLHMRPESESLDGLRLLLMPDLGDHSHAIETTKASANPLIKMPRETQSEPAHNAKANATAVATSNVMKA